MNRLQKKCIISTAGMHLLLLTILIFGPAFFNRQPKPDNTVLTVIPANLVDSALNTGVRDAQAPAPTPTPTVIPPSLLRPPPPVTATAPAIPRVVQPPEPPTPSLLEQFEKYFSHTQPTPTVTPDLKQVERRDKTPHDNNIKVSLKKVTRRDFSKTNPAPTTDNTSNARAINNALKSLEKSLAPGTRIDMPGTASAAYANYANVVQSVYEQALRGHIPDHVASNSESTKVRVTIASDGTVVSADIISRSGDPTWDQAVQSTLDQVTSIAPFPAGSTEKERHYTLSFNPDVERSF